MTTPATPLPGHPFGTAAGAQTWWATIAPGGKVPDSWTKGAAPRIASSSDGMYSFAGQSKDDGSGYGQIGWYEDNGSGVPQSPSLVVNWGTDGVTSGTSGATAPQAPDKGQVTPVQPFGNLDWTQGLGNFISALMDKQLWIRIGEGALAVALLGGGFYVLLKKEGVA